MKYDNIMVLGLSYDISDKIKSRGREGYRVVSTSVQGSAILVFMQRDVEESISTEFKSVVTYVDSRINMTPPIMPSDDYHTIEFPSHDNVYGCLPEKTASEYGL